METAATPMIGWLDMNILPVADEEIEESDDLLHDTGVPDVRRSFSSPPFLRLHINPTQT